MTDPPDKNSFCKPLDWNLIHNFVAEKSNSVLNGIKQHDVDWFLRESSVSVAPDPSKEANNVSADTNGVTRQTLNSSSIQTPASPHLTISNTNEHNLAKTKPSISPILEEPALPDNYLDYAKKNAPPTTRRRSSVTSIASMSSASSNGSNGGLFSKLKSKFHKPDSAPSSPALAPVNTSSVFKSDYDMRLSRTDSPGLSPVEPKAEKKEPKPESQDLADPRLEEYVRFYKQENRSRSSSVGLIRRSSLKLDNGGILEGCLLNAVPPKKQAFSAESPVPASKFSAFLRRRSTIVPEKDTQLTLSFELAVSESSNSVASEPIPQFQGLKPMKRVAFHSLTFLIDPPQQIPSRTPRLGNVEILPSGVVRVNPLTEADKLAIEKSQKGLGGGLVVGGTGALGLIEKPEGPNGPVDIAREKDEPNEVAKKDSNGDDDTKIDEHAKSLSIDKPMLHHRPVPGYTVPIKKMALDLMYTRCCHLREILPIPAIAKQIPKGSMAPLTVLQLRNPTPTMIEIQTFADFIRIAPIMCISLDGVNMSLDQFKVLLSAMCSKKQLEKLSLRNTPIDAEGWSLLCWFLSRNKVLQRLDITQCPPLSVNVLKKKKKKTDKKPEEEIIHMTCNKENRSDMDWALFTATIIARGGIEELILTGCCIADLEIFEKFIKHAVMLKTYKLGMAYNQLVPQQIRILLEYWVLSELSRGLDLGYNDFLSSSYLNVFLEIEKSPSFSKLVAKTKLGFLSLNATNLRFNEYFKEVFEKFFLKLPNLKYLDLSNNPKLFGVFQPVLPDSPQKTRTSSEDSSLSVSEKLLPEEYSKGQEAIVSYFTSKLPLFGNLLRLHLENNGLTSQSLVDISQIIPFCKNLGYLSIIGNQLDLVSATAIIQGLKNSKSLLTLDCDYHLLPEAFKERIGLYTMRNMEYIMKSLASGSDTSSTETDAEEPSLTEQLTNILLMKATKKLDLQSPEVLQFTRKARSDRLKLKATITELLHLQWKNELNLEGKEALIRLLFIDSSLERGMKLIDNSLVEPEANLTSTDIIGIHLAEDEKNQHKSSVHSKIQDARAVQADLLSPVESCSLPYSRTQSLTSLNNLNKQEGSVLKLLNLLKLHKGDEPLFDKFDVYSGEEIRRKLLDVNMSGLDKMITYLGNVRKEGVSLKTLFNDPKGHEDFNLLVEIRQKLSHLQEAIPSDGVPVVVPQPETETLENDTKVDDGEAINQAYDEVLSKFEKPPK